MGQAQTIAWHEQCLTARVNFLCRLEREAAEASASVKQTAEENDHYRRQIQRARRLGKAAFDPDRFKPDEVTT